ncbi:hypothetical protein [Amycolatopsis sp. NPDC059657]|uniref:hypothetical protein n=1 Tax=Amycolatopsis sp. NPDC059657 TaxID=3346899 RepID=UPI00366EE8A4
MKRFRSPLAWAVVGTVLALVAVTWWMLADPATSRGDALKTGGLAGGAVAAMYGLWLNDRRRRTEEDRHEIERARVADERFAKAVELLGNAADPVRVGAMHTLQALARARPEYTQNVLDVLCGYLRLRFDHPDFDAVRPRDFEWTPETAALADREQQVRRTAQAVIRSLLPHPKQPDAPEYALDLTGARLERFNMARKKIKWLTLTRCQIIGGAGFQDAVIPYMFFLNEAETWGEVTFADAKFGSRAGFTDFTAHDPVDFTGAEFTVEPELDNAVFPEGSTLPARTG